ncbi:MAG: hypothetical protein QXJ17_01470 [Nitrososphaeria archaeon]
MLEKSNDSNPIRWLNVLSFILTVMVNGLAGITTIIGGKKQLKSLACTPH